MDTSILSITPNIQFMARTREDGYQCNPPLIWWILGLKKNQFLVFHLDYSDIIEDVKEYKKKLTEVFSLLPHMPIIFPVTPKVPQTFIDNISMPNLYLASSLNDSEVSYLVYNSLALITASPSLSYEITTIEIVCLSNSDVD